MITDSFRKTDVGPFLDLAEAEGWLSDRQELDFLLRVFPMGCFVARDDTGAPGAFITSVSYGRSGWIGNLIVRGDRRRCGTGTLLLTQALRVLSDAGVDTVWLTASEQGAPLYQRIGFTVLDRIERWGINRSLVPNRQTASAVDNLLRYDRLGWGDDRAALMDEKLRQGVLVTYNDENMVLQQCAGYSQIGPWCGAAPWDAKKQLESILDWPVAPGETYLDVPAGNRQITSMLAENGFFRRGTTLLMYQGTPPHYCNEHVYALATMGSSG